MIRLSATSMAFAAAVATAGPAPAAAPITPADALHLLAAAGMSWTGQPPHVQVLNPCQHATAPQVRFLDLNGDGRPEAVTMDHDPACYGPDPGYQSKILTRTANGRWQVVAVMLGVFQPLPARMRGWVDFTSQNGSCRPVFRWAGSAYAAAPGCGKGGAAVADAPPAKSGKPSSSVAAAEPSPVAEAPTPSGVPGPDEQLKLFPATYGRFAPRGDCTRLPRVTVGEDAIRLETASGNGRFTRPNVVTNYVGPEDQSITYQLHGPGEGLAMSIEGNRLWTSGGDPLTPAERALDAAADVDGKAPLRRCQS